MHVDSFSGIAAACPRGKRNPEGVLEALRRSPWVSTFDMGERRWLRDSIARLERDGLVRREQADYPWLRYVPVAARDGGEA